MSKPNTRQLDRLIQTAEAKLQGVRNGEISSLSAGEQARVFVHIGRGVRRVVRGKSTSAPDRAIDRIFQTAEQRYASELQAAQQAKAQVISQHAGAKVAKKTESRWW